QYCIGDPVSNIQVSVAGTPAWSVDYTLNGVAMSASGSTSPVYLGNSAVTYVITAITDLNCSNAASGSETITIIGCDITVPTAFTPDGDGVNETWEIVDLDAVYPGNVVSIYNRWGNMLYQHDSSSDGPYDSDRWDGTFNGDALPVGSYYFIIDLGGDEEPLSGTVSILKK
ncbi:MAG: gliding motility-associated C-terminal domain-containing protein, partial [Bacteroidota bacterium]